LNRAIAFITERLSQIFATQAFFQASLLQEFANLPAEKFFLFFGNHNSRLLIWVPMAEQPAENGPDLQLMKGHYSRRSKK
jgi:hypothetical protein